MAPSFIEDPGAFGNTKMVYESSGLLVPTFFPLIKHQLFDDCVLFLWLTSYTTGKFSNLTTYIQFEQKMIVIKRAYTLFKRGKKLMQQLYDDQGIQPNTWYFKTRITYI